MEIIRLNAPEHKRHRYNASGCAEDCFCQTERDLLREVFSTAALRFSEKRVYQETPVFIRN